MSKITHAAYLAQSETEHLQGRKVDKQNEPVRLVCRGFVALLLQRGFQISSALNLGLWYYLGYNQSATGSIARF